MLNSPVYDFAVILQKLQKGEKKRGGGLVPKVTKQGNFTGTEVGGA